MSRHQEVSSARLDLTPDAGSAGAGADVSPIRKQATHLLNSPEGQSISAAAAAAAPQGDVTLPKVALTDAAVATAGAAAGAVRQPLDSTKSLSELASTGAIVDRTTAGDAAVEQPPTSDATKPRISVGMQDLNATDAAKPHFVIKEDGQIEMLGNPETLNAKDVQVMLERQPGQLNPTDAQTKAADELVKYLADRMGAKDPTTGVELNDKDNVVSPETEQAKNLKPPSDTSNMTPQTRDAVQQSNRLGGANGVDMPRAATDGMMSHTRGVPRQPNESDKTMGVKEAVAGLWRPDQDKPYETIRRHPDGGYRVGRYGFSGRQINAFLAGLGDPPDPALIEKLIKEGKLPKDFAEKLKNPEFLAKLKNMATKMDQGQAPNKSDVATLLPKEAQEAIAGTMIDQIKGKFGDNAGVVSAGMLSGKAPGDLTQADFSSPEGQQMTQAGQRLYDVAMNQQRTEKEVAGTIPQGERRPLIEGALIKAGVSPSEANVQAVSLMVEKESSWDPNNVNNWDSNARKGTPSKGLMQTIGPTFDSYSIPGHKNIFNPEDNLIAGIRYAVDRYGSLQNVPGVRGVRNRTGYVGY